MFSKSLNMNAHFALVLACVVCLLDYCQGVETFVPANGQRTMDEEMMHPSQQQLQSLVTMLLAYNTGVGVRMPQVRGPSSQMQYLAEALNRLRRDEDANDFEDVEEQMGIVDPGEMDTDTTSALWYPSRKGALSESFFEDEVEGYNGGWHVFGAEFSEDEYALMRKYLEAFQAKAITKTLPMLTNTKAGEAEAFNAFSEGLQEDLQDPGEYEADLEKIGVYPSELLRRYIQWSMNEANRKSTFSLWDDWKF
mmetsp:Transcript_64971/g.102315  ORF Transcript_64971/g.102315 Transcript_64971/m.102315 type:complete len:251 (+) Transcript_64971:30-782(+)